MRKKPVVTHWTGRASPPFAMSIAAAILMTAAACSKPEQAAGLECSLVELRARPVDRSYDAVVRMDAVNIEDPVKGRFQVLTPSLDLDLAGLSFEVEGQDPDILEPGDVFVVPLNRTDWKFGLAEGETVYCYRNFWDQLPPQERFHPTKTEAMDVARSLEIINDEGFVKPVPKLLPPEWVLVDEKFPTADDTLGDIIYQKRRGDLILEHVEIQYAYLTEEDKEELATVPAVEFLSKWSDCAQESGHDVMVAGRPAVACDLEGQGDFAWTYRYFTVTGGLLLAVEIQSDPREWGKTEEEKELERRTDRVFLRHAFGPVGPEEWQVLIEIRMNLGGAFHKRSRAGETVDKEFSLTEDEFGKIKASLEENKFSELESRSGGSRGGESSISAEVAGKSHTVRMKNYASKPYDAIAAVIRRIVLPKVGEK